MPSDQAKRREQQHERRIRAREAAVSAARSEAGADSPNGSLVQHGAKCDKSGMCPIIGPRYMLMVSP